MNAYFVIEMAFTAGQVCILRGLEQEQIKWLKILSGRIPQSSLVQNKPRLSSLGLFTFSEFRTFIGDIGYQTAVSEADAIYRP